MKLFNCNSCLLVSAFVSITVLSSSAYANQNNKLVIVNHFDKPLQYTISENHEGLPELPVTFKLEVNGVANSKVIDIQKESYVGAIDDEGKTGFWGVDIEGNKTHFHGYVSQGIAYSWKAETIIFCTPADYKKNGQCV